MLSHPTKTTINDANTRVRWIFHNPPEDDLWYCHYCGKPLTVDADLLEMGVERLFLDHKLTRSSHPELRYDVSNLLPSCYMDNSRRGSMLYETYIQKYYKGEL